MAAATLAAHYPDLPHPVPGGGPPRQGPLHSHPAKAAHSHRTQVRTHGGTTAIVLRYACMAAPTPSYSGKHVAAPTQLYLGTHEWRQHCQYILGSTTAIILRKICGGEVNTRTTEL